MIPFGFLIVSISFLIVGCSPNKKAQEPSAQEESPKTQWRVVEHAEESPVNIKDFKIFIKEFKKALEEKNWPRVHAMWGDAEEAKKTNNPYGKHPDVEWQPEIYEIVSISSNEKNCKPFYYYDVKQKKYKLADYFCEYETSKECYHTVFLYEHNRWVYAYTGECGD